MEAIAGILFFITSFLYKGKVSVMLAFFGLGLFISYISYSLRERVQEKKKEEKDPLKTACEMANMVADRGGYKCTYCDFPEKPCPNKLEQAKK